MEDREKREAIEGIGGVVGVGEVGGGVQRATMDVPGVSGRVAGVGEEVSWVQNATMDVPGAVPYTHLTLPSMQTDKHPAPGVPLTDTAVHQSFSASPFSTLAVPRPTPTQCAASHPATHL